MSDEKRRRVLASVGGGMVDAHGHSTAVRRTHVDVDAPASVPQSTKPSPEHERVIIHVDMDCFYAQVEMVDNPSLSSRPVGVYQKYLIVTTNYVARQMGVPKMVKSQFLGERRQHSESSNRVGVLMSSDEKKIRHHHESVRSSQLHEENLQSAVHKNLDTIMDAYTGLTSGSLSSTEFTQKIQSLGLTETSTVQKLYREQKSGGDISLTKMLKALSTPDVGPSRMSPAGKPYFASGLRYSTIGALGDEIQQLEAETATVLSIASGNIDDCSNQMAHATSDVPLKDVDHNVQKLLQTRRGVLKSILRRYDGDKDGRVSYEEFNQSLKASNIELGRSDLVSVYRAFDPEGTGTLDIYRISDDIIASAPLLRRVENVANVNGLRNSTQEKAEPNGGDGSRVGDSTTYGASDGGDKENGSVETESGLETHIEEVKTQGDTGDETSSQNKRVVTMDGPLNSELLPWSRTSFRITGPLQHARYAKLDHSGGKKSKGKLEKIEKNGEKRKVEVGTRVLRLKAVPQLKPRKASRVVRLRSGPPKVTNQ